MYKREAVKCGVCNTIKTLACRSIKKAIKKHGVYMCQSCVMKQPKFSKANSDRVKKRFETQESREELSKKIKEYYEDPAARKKASANSKKLWQNSDYRATQIASTQQSWQDEAYKNKVTEGVKKSWTDERKRKQSDITKKLWEDVDYQLKRDAGMRKSYTPYRRKQLSLQSKKLWQNPKYRSKLASSMVGVTTSVLDNTIISLAKRLGYEAEPIAIGPWTFDALIEHNNKKLLVECQGDYYHNKPERMIRDKQKRTYYDNHLSDQYDLLIIWEHEFYCIGRISDLLKNQFYEKVKPVCFNLRDLVIEIVDHNIAKKFYNQFHYLKKYRSGPLNIAAKLDGAIVAVISFSSPTRKESQTRLGLENGELLELVRMCVNPQFQNKNLLSFLLSKTVKTIRSNTKVKAIITFADTTLGHTGAAYKASNFKFDGEAKPTYWYIDQNGYYRHKKTVWDQANRLGKKEIEYANYCKLTKVKGKKLLRFIYRL
tara:strand:- start:589 stop:2043 length:1455 start_codon:yes stop_codon:yes gene_type:complete